MDLISGINLYIRPINGGDIVVTRFNGLTIQAIAGLFK